MTQILKTLKSWYGRGNNAWDGASGLDQDLVHLDNHFGNLKHIGAIAAGTAASAMPGIKGIAKLYVDGTYAVTNLDAAGALIVTAYSASAGLLASDGIKIYINTGSGWSSPSSATFTSVPSTDNGQVITVTAPHLRQMVWNGASYVRAPWHQPGLIQHSIDNPASIIGYLPVRADVAYAQSNYPDLIGRLGLSGVGNFSLLELRGEFIRCLDNGRGVDAGRVSGAAQLDQFKQHQHMYGYSIYANPPLLGSGGYAGLTLQNNGSFGNTYATDTFGAAIPGGTETRARNVALPAWVSY